MPMAGTAVTYTVSPRGTVTLSSVAENQPVAGKFHHQRDL